MRALIAGGDGQVGSALRACAPSGVTVLAAGRDRLDITNASQAAALVAEFRPDVLINAAAYTAVDKAEAEPDRAFKVNAEAVGQLARICADARCRLVHLSTDFVFDGAKSTPYHPGDAPQPLSVYGASKRAGEEAAGQQALVVRTSWIHAARGQNFVRTMLRLMAERDAVRVIADQIGAPTHAADLAAALWALVQEGAHGIHHYTNAGVASWYDFAVAVHEEALALGLLDREIPVVPITTRDYPLPARRPNYSVLDCTATWAVLGCPAPHWRASLRAMLKEMKANG